MQQHFTHFVLMCVPFFHFFILNVFDSGHVGYCKTKQNIISLFLSKNFDQNYL